MTASHRPENRSDPVGYRTTNASFQLKVILRTNLAMTPTLPGFVRSRLRTFASLGARCSAQPRVLTRFVQEYTLTADVKPACGDEVVEGRPGDARDLGDRALRYAELEEVADLVLPAVEARHAQRPLRPSVVRAMRCLGRCAHGWACGCPSTRRISLTEQYVLNDHGRHQKAHVRRLRSANHAQERDPGPAAETLRPAPGKAPRRR